MMDSSQEADFKAQKVKGFAKGLVARKMTDHHSLELGSVTLLGRSKLVHIRSSADHIGSATAL